MAIRINHKDNSLQFNKVTEPASPDAGTVVLYIDSTTGNVTLKNEGGTVSTVGDLLLDTTPQLGGTLDVNDNIISNGTAVIDLNDVTASTIQSADGTTGLQLSIYAGTGSGGAGGALTLIGGQGSTTGGDLTITGGQGLAGAGGTVLVTPGQSSTAVGGSVVIGSPASATTAPSLTLNEGAINGTDSVSLKAPDAVTASVIWTLPQDTQAAAAGKFITAAAADGVLSFATAVKNPLAADLDVSTFLVKASASTYLDLDDTTTTLHTAAALKLSSVTNITIEPDSTAGTAGTTTVRGGQDTAGVGGNLILAGGVGSTTNGIVEVTGNLEATGNVVSHLGINSQTGTTYELVLADDGKIVSMNNGAANILTIPANASVAFPVGTQILIEQEGAGQTTIAITTDTLHSAGSLLSLTGQYSTATLIKKSATVWLLAGDLA